MKEYNKIKTLWKREEVGKHNMIVGEYAEPEFELLKDIVWVATEKLDGTNIRIMWDGNKVSFGGKTDKAQLPVHLFDRLTELFSGEANEQMFEQTFDCGDVCLYGEGVGAKIQKGGGNYGTVDFVLFDIKIGKFWLKRESVEGIARKFGIKVAPILMEGTLQKISDFVSIGFNSEWGEFTLEGVVARPKIEILKRNSKRIITKLKHKDFVKLQN